MLFKANATALGFLLFCTEKIKIDLEMNKMS